MSERTTEDVRAYLIGCLQRAIEALRSGQVQRAIDIVDGWRENSYKLPLDCGQEPGYEVPDQQLR